MLFVEDLLRKDGARATARAFARNDRPGLDAARRRLLFDLATAAGEDESAAVTCGGTAFWVASDFGTTAFLLEENLEKFLENPCLPEGRDGGTAYVLCSGYDSGLWRAYLAYWAAELRARHGIGAVFVAPRRGLLGRVSLRLADANDLMARLF